MSTRTIYHVEQNMNLNFGDKYVIITQVATFHLHSEETPKQKPPTGCNSLNTRFSILTAKQSHPYGV